VHVWRPTSPGNEDVIICINASFMTQRVLKPWWLWIYQNSAVKRASARAIPGWVTSWEVRYGEPKVDNIVSLGVGRYMDGLRRLPNSVDFWNSTPCWILIDLAFGRCCSDVRMSSLLSVGHCEAFELLQRLVQMVAQEPVDFPLEFANTLHGYLLEACG